MCHVRSTAVGGLITWTFSSPSEDCSISRANLYPYRTCSVPTFGHAGTNLGRAAGRDLFLPEVTFLVGAINPVPGWCSQFCLALLAGIMALAMSLERERNARTLFAERERHEVT